MPACGNSLVATYGGRGTDNPKAAACTGGPVCVQQGISCAVSWLRAAVVTRYCGKFQSGSSGRRRPAGGSAKQGVNKGVLVLGLPPLF